MIEIMKLFAKDGLELSCLYSKVENPKALVQIVHGMAEHKERYTDLIKFLNGYGYTVIISDLRGHGLSVNGKYPLGHIESIDELIDDQMIVTNFLKRENPGVDIYMYSHSFGTCISRNYIMKHDDEIKKLILSGTVGYNPGSRLGARIGARRMKKDKYQQSDLLFSFTNNLSKKEDFNWLSVNEENIKVYMEDELCGFKFDVSGYYTLFTSVQNLRKTDMYECKNKDLKILSISGKEDRTTLGTKGIKKSLAFLNKAGYANTSFIEYPNMKHEILQEKNNEQVLKDILQFFE